MSVTCPIFDRRLNQAGSLLYFFTFSVLNHEVATSVTRPIRDGRLRLKEIKSPQEPLSTENDE